MFFFPTTKKITNIEPYLLNHLMFNYSRKTLLFLSIVMLIFCSCSSRKNILFNTENEKSASSLPVYELKKGADTSSNKLQIIQPGDLLSIRNLQNDLLINGGITVGSNNQGGNLMNQNQNQSYRVEADGSVIIPVLGSIRLGGLNRLEAQELLTKLYSQELLKDPIITVTIVNYQITFLGEFNKQGNYTLQKEQNHLVQLIGEAGGLTNRANKRRIKIIRGDLSNPEVLVANLEDINSLSNPKLYLKNNDIIYAEPRGGFQFLDRINPATSLLGVGLSVINIYLLIQNLNK